MPRYPSDALLAHFGTRLGPLADLKFRSTPWASATFTGARHVIAFTVEAAADVDGFAATIGEDEIAIWRGFVADITVTRAAVVEDGVRLRIEALTIDDE